jgi:hypothetical protein
MEEQQVRISPISIAQIVAATGVVPQPVLYGWDGAILRPDDFRSPDGFGPNAPLAPAIRESGYPPAEYQITPGFNLIPTPMMEPGTTAKLHPAVKRAYADMCPYYRIAVGYRKNQVRSRKWAVVPREKSRSVKERKAHEKDIGTAMRFLDKPNRVDRLDITTWLEQALEETLVLDATVFHKQLHWDGSLSYVQTDGVTIKTIIDEWGHTVGFQQVLWGRPRTQYNAPVYEDFSVGEMAYWIYHPRVTGSYGTSAIEEIIPIMETAIERAKTHRGWYTEGTVPDAFLQAPAGLSTSKQIAEYQEYLDNMLRGTNRRKLRVVANGSVYQPVKPFDFKREEEDAIASILLAHMGVPKMILVNQVNRATAEAQAEDAGDVGLAPMIAWLEAMLSEIVQEDLGFPALKVICADGLAAQDEADTDNDVKLINAKVLRPEEVREKRGLAPAEEEGGAAAQKGISAEYLTRAIFEAGVITRDELRATLQLPPDPINGGLYVTIGAFGATPPEDLAAASAGVPAPAPAFGPQPPAQPGAVAPLPIPGGGKDAERDHVVSDALATLTGKPVEEPAAAKAERGTWRRFATNRFEKGAHRTRFSTSALSEADVHAIRIHVHGARTKSALLSAFEKKAALTEAVKDKAAGVVARAARRMFEQEKKKLLADAKAKLKDKPEEKSAKTWWARSGALSKDAVGDTFVDSIENALKTVYGKAATDANVTGLDFDYLDKNAARYAKERGAEMIGTNDNEWSVSQTTRDAANELLQGALDDGISYQEFAKRLDEAGLFSDARADLIARTEIGLAQNYGQVETYQAAGFKTVIVQDGDCDECKEVDGEEWPVERALEEPLQHPACVRSFIPGELAE